MTRSHNQAGFTLVELMVSLSLFVIVVLALVGSLFTVNDASRKVQAMRTVMDNVSFAMESMSRTIRTSTDIICGGPGYEVAQNCRIQDDVLGTSVQHTAIEMKSTLGEHRLVQYQWVLDANDRGQIQKKSTGLTDTNLPNGDVRDWVAITAPEINIEKFAFFVDGAEQNDGLQPSVIIKMEGVATVDGGINVPFAVQTYLSQRTPEDLLIL